MPSEPAWSLWENAIGCRGPFCRPSETEKDCVNATPATASVARMRTSERARRMARSRGNLMTCPGRVKWHAGLCDPHGGSALRLRHQLEQRAHRDGLVGLDVVQDRLEIDADLLRTEVRDDARERTRLRHRH